MGRNNVNMLSGSVTKGLISMILPIMISNVMQSIFSAIDMTVLKIYSSDLAVGAVGACSNLISLSTALLIGISLGANMIVARRLGAGDKTRAEKAAVTAIKTALIGGLILMGIGVLLAETFLRWTNCHESLLPQAVTYLRLYFCAVPMLMVYNFCASVLRATGDTKRPMYFLLLNGVIKVILNFLFVARLDMDVASVAVATIIASLVSCSLSCITLFKLQNVMPMHFFRTRFDTREFREIIRIGIPAGVQAGMLAFANVAITATANSFGADATTGVSIANQFESILYQITAAPGVAVAPFVSQNIGAGNIPRVKKTILCGVLITTISTATLGALSAIFSGQLAGIMSTSPAIIGYAKQKMIITSIPYFIAGINELMSGVLRSIGKPIVPTVTSLLFICLLRFAWVYAIFPLYPNLGFLYLVWPIGWFLSVITQLIVYLHRIKKLQLQAS
ncbi:MAG: MATE family efflux transporter [Clostridia bacterium]|nr:MATE family efflux transporter [Clostridia bacterium]